MTDESVSEMTAEEALAELGVTADMLTAEEGRQLDENGFVVLEGVLDAATLEGIQQGLAEISQRQHPATAPLSTLRELAELDMKGLRRQIETQGNWRTWEMSEEKISARMARMQAELEALERALAGDEVGALRDALLDQRCSEVNTADFLWDVFESDPVFDVALNTPRVLAAASHVLGPEIHLSVIAFRWPRAGHGEQDMHRNPGPPADAVNCVWLFDDMTLDNGPTRMVPGSHLLDRGPGHELNGDLRAPHPREVLITGKAGSVVVFDDRIYHAGTNHNGGGPRRTMQSVFTARTGHRGLRLKRKEETLARLTPAQIWLIDLEAAPTDAAAN